LSEITTRRATLDDLAVVREVLDAHSSHHLGRPTSEDEALMRLRMGPEPIEANATLAFVGLKAVGFAHTWVGEDDLRAVIRVDPNHHDQGVAAALLAAVEKRAAENWRAAGGELSPELSITAGAKDTAAAEFLRETGFAPVRHFFQMRIPLASVAASDTPLPPGATLRPFEPGADDEGIFSAFRESFADHWGNADPDAGVWWRENRDDPASGYDPTLWLVVEAAGAIAGFAVCREQEENEQRIGWVSLVGVTPRSRGMGLGETLLRAALLEFQRRGLAEAALSVDVDNSSGALRLYEKVGMTAAPAFSVWSKKLLSA